MKILLSQTPEFFPTANKWAPPVGILYLAAVLEEMDVDITILDPAVENLTVPQFIDTVAKQSPDIFGLYVTSDTYFTTARVVKAVKEKLPKTVIMAGGPHPTLLAGDMFENLPELDIIVRGEGEIALPMIIERLQKQEALQGIPNTSFRQAGEIIHNSETSMIEDLDTIPFPALHKVDYEKYNFAYHVPGKGELKAINVTTTRGCPFNCNFCSNTNLWGRKIRMRSVKNIIEEIQERMESYGVTFFYFYDDTFNISVPRLLEFCDTIEKEQLNIHWACGVRADTMTKEILSRMRETGLVFANFGVETINDHLREKVIGKQLTREMLNRTINAFNELRVQCGMSFMVSLPDENRDMMEENIRFIEELTLENKDSAVHYNITRIYPGTRLEVEARERGVLKEGFTWFDEKKIREFSPGILTGLYGNVPIYKEKLSYIDIFSCLFRWKNSKNFSSEQMKTYIKGNLLLSYLWKYIKSIKHPKDVLLLSQAGLAWFLVLFKRLFSK